MATGNSAASLAERVGLRRQNISKFLSSRVYPSDGTVARISNVIVASGPTSGTRPLV